MSEIFYIKRGDTSPAIRYLLQPASIDLTGASVKFQTRNAKTKALVLDAVAEVYAATGAPAVQYAWIAGDTDTAGTYDAEFRVTYADGSIETFPNNGFIRVQIGEDIR